MAIGKDPVSLLNRLLLKVGVKLKQSRSEKLPNGNKLRFYKVDAEALTDPDRHAILAALDLRWKLQQEEKLKREQAWLELVELSKQEAAKPTTITSQSHGVVESRCQEGVSRSTTEELVESLNNDDSGPIEELKQAFEFCELPHQFAMVIEGYPSEVVERAIALAPDQPRQRQLSEWWESLQKSATAVERETNLDLPALDTYVEGDEVWAYFPHSEAKWLRATVEWVRDRMVRVKCGFLGMLIERTDLIAPGSWQLSG
jgi:hypothetical protein